MGLSKQELATIHATSLGNFAITFSCSDDGFWLGTVRVRQPGAEYKIVTARGDIKTWRNVADAIHFIQLVCPNCDDISIQFGDWSFIKAPEIKAQ